MRTMTVKEGSMLPEAVFVVMGPEGPKLKSTREIFDGRRVALFGLPGAYTPICHREHLPGIVALRETLTRHGIDTVACTAVNDVFVLERWAADHDAQGKILMLADGNAVFATRAGLTIDLSEYGLGIRSNRYAMVVASGRVVMLSLEEAFMTHKKSSAAALCERMERAPV
jgi:peroxiredoxin